MKTVIEMAREAGFTSPVRADGYMGLAYDRREGGETGGSLERLVKLVRVEALAEQPAQQEHDAIGCKCSECGAWQRWSPSGMVCKNGHGGVSGVNHRLYTSPPAQRKPLMDEQIRAVIAKIDPNEHYLPNSLRQLARAIEAAHGIKENT